MIIRGAVIHRDGHGNCGLLPTHSFLRTQAGLAASASSFCRDQLRTQLIGASLITCITHALPLITGLACPAGK